MQEIELKFGIAPQRRAAVRRAVLQAGVPALRLRAAYYDTPQGHLAAAGMALRLRQEGQAWVQTLKLGLDPIRRLEHNVTLAAVGEEVPALDPARHAGTPVGVALQAACGSDGLAALQLRFATDITRHVRVLQGADGLSVELALDEGTVSAADQVERVCELEIELLQGEPAGLIALASDWVTRLDLWLDVRAKSWRGEYLARGQCYVPALKAVLSKVPPKAEVGAAQRTLLQACLAQVLVNASQIAAPAGAGDAARPYEPEHVHQLRVGLRRLRAVLRVFKGTDWGVTVVDEPLAVLLRRLGEVRDHDVCVQEMGPALQAAGAPAICLPALAAAPLAEALRDPALTRTWLALLAATQPAAVTAGAAPERWRERVTPHLRRWHKRMRAAALAPHLLNDVQLHRLRKQAKRLRYVAEFSASLWPGRPLERQLKALRTLQDGLGQWHDHFVAQERFNALVAQEPAAWFAVGWLRARRDTLRAQVGQDLQRWVDVPVPWQKPKKKGLRRRG